MAKFIQLVGRQLTGFWQLTYLYSKIGSVGGSVPGLASGNFANLYGKVGSVGGSVPGLASGNLANLYGNVFSVVGLITGLASV